MKFWFFLMLLGVTTTAYAEVYKCVDKQGSTNYQAKPCDAAAKEKVMEIKSDAAKEADGKIKMQQLEADYDASKSREAQQANALLNQQQQLQQQQMQYLNNNPGVVMPPSNITPGR